MSERCFPLPWIAEERDACFVVRDHNGQALAYVYFEDEPGRRAAAKLLERDEARRIAANIAKLLVRAAQKIDVVEKSMAAFNFAGRLRNQSQERVTRDRFARA